MSIKLLPQVTVRLEKIVGGGQSLGTLDDGRKLFVWGGLPGELVRVQLTKRKSSYAEGIVSEVLEPSLNRVSPKDPTSFLSTSPWQILSLDTEQHYKAALIEEAFELHDLVLPNPITVYTDGRAYAYRNKVEFSWYGDTDTKTGRESLQLAFFKRGSKGKIPVYGSSLLTPSMNELAEAIRALLEAHSVPAYALKTLLIRCNQAGECVWQLYIKDKSFSVLTADNTTTLPALGGEVIYSNPLSPASVQTKRLLSVGTYSLSDTILGTEFHYAAESFFQVNIPVYEEALRDIRSWIPADTPVLDLYSGVGTIGLTVGGEDVTLVEINESAAREMRRNVAELAVPAKVVHAAAEEVVHTITPEQCVIVDPPRAGLHETVMATLLRVQPSRIIYLSCNPVTQARDVSRLAGVYGIRAHKGYNFFPRTPHNEHLVILDLQAT